METTYAYPLGVDPVIYNLPDDGTANTSNLRPTQIRGRIFVPQSLGRDGSTPIIVLFPGRHADCRHFISVPDFGPYPMDNEFVDNEGNCPEGSTIVESYRGFDYLGRSLVADGYIVLSMDPLMLNRNQEVAEDAYLIRARARLLLRTLEKLELWNKSPDESKRILGRDISGSVNTTAIGLMGHSRGGAAVRVAANLIMTPGLLGFKERISWSSKLDSRIMAVWEVSPFDGPEGGESVAVVGPAWGLLASGCEDDLVNFAYLSLYRRQSRLNGAPNYFVTAYGANHNFFNTEWSKVTYDPFAPTFQYPLGKGQSIDVPLVMQSSSQQGLLERTLSTFMNAHLGGRTKISFASELISTAKNSPHGVVSNVEIGLSNPNLASSRILQSFASTSGIVISPTSDQYVCSFMDHAKNQFPSFKEDVKKFGLPRNLATTKIATPLQLVTDADYDDGVVVGLPLANLSSIFVPFDNTIRPVTSTDNCEIQIDIARRDPCVHAASGVANDCGGPQTLNVQVYAGNTMSNTVSLKSRYSVEFAPYDMLSADYSVSDMALLRVVWETVSLKCPKQNDGAGLNITVTVPPGERALPRTKASFLYLGTVRQVIGRSVRLHRAGDE
ncbi:hypothetical protein MAA_10157 [Metarhizium robertsii ARSEF 23]|uniref:Uncharacterized protein n=1 Tax=Metarhizium robertsii (strain ARSEF 23 / ATCC MYA-3075) TaxID=655844 RepID=E9FD08_METRA|nr:uncharacterized protein MAA_10157 [Metarhizium robertsii ARSEF 23]EFY94386.2 hypothetical protein MAA_10157 [Metarhizium robertsii ARSEF 23]